MRWVRASTADPAISSARAAQAGTGQPTRYDWSLMGMRCSRCGREKRELISNIHVDASEFALLLSWTTDDPAPDSAASVLVARRTSARCRSEARCRQQRRVAQASARRGEDGPRRDQG